MNAMNDTSWPEQKAVPAGQDEVEDGDLHDNLGDADVLGDLSDPAIDGPSDVDTLDGQPDGDRQLTTGSDALDTGLNDSDLGADVAGLPPSGGPPAADDREGFAGLMPDTPQGAGTDGTGDRATGLLDLRG